MKVLTLNEKLRYRDLKPIEIDGNQFSHHLNTVVENGYVDKFGIYYFLTLDGKMYADRVELSTFLPRVQPKIVTMIHCKNDKDEVLLFRRKRSPLSGLVHIPYGKIHMGEKVEEAAHRELKEKAGLSASLSHIGDVYVRVYDGDELIAHVLHHVFSGTNPSGELSEIDAGIPFWSKIKDIPKKERVGGLDEIISIIKKKSTGLFFEEFDLRLQKRNLQT